MRPINADAIDKRYVPIAPVLDGDAVHYEWIAFVEDINEAPTIDAVPVIRCKDCKNYGTDGNRLNCNVFCCSMPENGFCSMGERKEE